MVTPIGRLIGTKIALGSDYHRISAIVQITLKVFPEQVWIRLADDAVTTNYLDYVGRELKMPGMFIVPACGVPMCSVHYDILGKYQEKPSYILGSRC